MNPANYYLDELKRRAERIPPRAFGRAELMAEAAHDAYLATTNELTRQGWNEEQALTVTRIFGQAVKEWITREDASWTALGTELDRRYTQWTGVSAKE
jgi:hypothetical protein